MRGTRPSRTAAKISKNIVYLAEDPESRDLLPRGAAESTERLLTAAGLLKTWELRLMRRPWFRRFGGAVERHTLPGATLHIGLRKRFIDDETRAAIADGANQVLAVGAGFDTLCLRLAAEFPDVTFVEVDHPATFAAKRSAVEALGALQPNLHLLGVDLASASLGEALDRAPTWRRDAASLVIAEGVLMYLEEAAVSAFLEAVRLHTARGSRALFTYLESDSSGRLRLGKWGFLVSVSLRMIGEPWRWSVRQGELQEFLEKRGYRLEPSRERRDLRRRYLEPAGLGDKELSDVELVALAETAEG